MAPWTPPSTFDNIAAPSYVPSRQPGAHFNGSDIGLVLFVCFFTYIFILVCAVFWPRHYPALQDNRVVDLETQVDVCQLPKYEEVEAAPPMYDEVVEEPFLDVFVVDDDEDEDDDEDYDPEAFGKW
ncbi:hypothetical protein CC86DRAFT_67688 [Ophiobolus disseminans]|uniref:Uncharacterized protein n=1 Tax=Ophiobolus disseminans TaxID=1469910 RepID=A0A6A6ZRN0_9PLEO|nr:hypothetical protein CC86DRAFT_67688 [Ophiobolus disseminans]